MPVTVRLPGALRDVTGGQTKLTASGGTLRDVIADIDRRHPGFASRVLDEKGALRSYVNVYIGDEDARTRGGPAAAVPDGSEVMVIPAMAGGRLSDSPSAALDQRRLVLPLGLREEIVAHARESAPQECCGLLLGEDEVARRALRCRNVHPTPETRYLIDSTQVFEAFKASKDFDRELVGIYHSHPRSAAYPSPTDRAEAHWPDAAYVLVSLRADEPELFAYRIRDGAVREIPLSEG